MTFSRHEVVPRPRHIATAILLALCLLSGLHADEPTLTRPDIVILNLDDWSNTSSRRFIAGGMAGDSVVADALRDHDMNYVEFRSCYVAQPACTPSRAALLRGQWPRRTGILFNGPNPPGTLNGGIEGYVARGHHENNLPQWLDLVEYETAHVGKYMNHFATSPTPPLSEDELGVAPLPGWDQWYNLQRDGFGGYHSFTLSENGEIVRYDDLDYSTDTYSNIARDVIRSTPPGTPLFLYWNPSAPHTPALPAPRHRGQFSHVQIPRPPENPAFLEEDVSDKPNYIQVRRFTEPFIIAEQDEYYRRTAESLNSVAEALVAMIEAFEASRNLENVVFMLTSDNGWTFLEHRVFGKGEAYEPSSRVPLIVFTKNRELMPRSGSAHQLVSHIDITGTVLDLANAAPPAGYDLDAVSFAPILRDRNAPSPREEVLVEVGSGRPGNPEVPRRRPDWSSVVTASDHPIYSRVKYTEYATGEKEIYLLNDDPHELENRIEDLEVQVIVEFMAERLAALKSLE